MNPARLTIFRRFTILIFCVITVMGTLFTIITYFATTYYHEASTQLLNKDVAWHIAKFTSPFMDGGISRQKADSVFQDAMVLSPAAEVYFLDSSGKVIYYHAAEKDIKEWNVGLSAITSYINNHGAKYIKGIDPKEPLQQKIFSAAVVKDGGRNLGFIYVILDSKISESVMGFLFGSHVLRLATQAIIVVIILSLVISLLYVKRMSRNFESMIKVLEKFETGDYTARFNIGKQNEFQPVAQAFNKMALLLTTSIDKLTHSEQERKNFLAAISHDLRTPLSIARGYIETLMLGNYADPAHPEKQQQYLLVHGKILQIHKMVTKIFELSKMEAVEFKPSKEPTVLSEIVQQTVDTFQLRAAEKSVALNCVQGTELLWIEADVSMIERVIQNLIENAVKNTPEHGSIHIQLAVTGNEIVFLIANTGEAMPQSLVEWVNDYNILAAYPAQRPHKSGLGLTIVQRILQLHGTSLHAKIIDGRNIFTFTFPRYQS